MNTHWRCVGARVLLSAKGRRFRSRVKADILSKRLKGLPLRGRLSVKVWLYPPDKRRRDIDNYVKSLLDALTHAGVWEDDIQIDHLEITRCDKRVLGQVVIQIEEINESTD